MVSGLGFRVRFSRCAGDEQQFAGRFDRLVENGNGFFLGESGRALWLLRQTGHELRNGKRGRVPGLAKQHQPGKRAESGTGRPESAH